MFRSNLHCACAAIGLFTCSPKKGMGQQPEAL